MKKNYTIALLVSFGFCFCSNFIYSQNPDQDGQWSPVIPMDIVPVAAANLPDGRLITWSSKYRYSYTETEDGMTFTEIFDPTSGTHGQGLGLTTSNTDHDMFCPGINNLPDGRILSAGGTSSERTSIYDPSTGLWSVASDMNIPRGYQGNVTLSDGSVFTLGGSWGDGITVVGGKDAELWSPETGWILLPGITGADIFTQNDLNTEVQGLYRVDNHLWLWAAPDGRIFHAGPSEEMHWIDVDNGGSIVSAGQRGTDTYSMKGNTVMFDIGKILKTGGAQSYSSNHPAKENAYVIDINTSTAQVTQVGDMNFERTMHNSTVLPNGQVLITGGLDHAEVFSDTGAALTAELFDPVTNTFTPVAGMATPRTYHSVAILLEDGRVFVGGGGLCDDLPTCVNHPDAEIYSPPYLFTAGGALATRPTISAPATANYNSNIAVTGSTNISEFSLIRSSAVTHSTNNEQRRIPVTHTGSAGNYSVAIPDRNLLPPGYYMLFALDTNGVPSVAEAIQIGDAIPLEDNPNLVLHLEFEETSGSTAFDSSGNGNDATIFDVDNEGATKVPSTDNWTTGLFGGGVEMDGFQFQSNTIIDVPYDSSFDPVDNSVTVMAWVNRDDIQYNVSVLSHNYPALFFGFHNSLYKWALQTSSGAVDCYAGYSPTGQWIHLAATYDGETARLFANGVEICTKAITGNINLDPNTPNFSSFTSSGFYDPNDPATLPPNNGSGVTDEIDGKIDELKIYNKALGAEEIKTFYELGVGLPGVENCPPGTITAEYKIGNGGWISGNNINAPEGSDVYIRAQTTGEYFVTTPEVDGNTFNSTTDFTQANGYQLDTGTKTGDNNGQISPTDMGQYVLTTANGCPTVITLNVLGSCDPGDTPVAAEWSTDGGNNWNSGAIGENVVVNVTEGDDVRLSLLPNNIGGDPGNPPLTFDVIHPNGSRDENLGDLAINAVTVDHAGIYILESEEGCSVAIDLMVDPVVCDASAIRAEWSLNGGQSYVQAPDELPVTVNAITGDEVILSMVPNGVNFTVTYEGNVVYTGQDYNLGSVDPANSGNYLITTPAGCNTTITLNVANPTCDATNIKAEWSLNGGTTFIEAPDEQNVVVSAYTGNNVLLSMVPNGLNFTVTYEGNVVYSGLAEHDLGAVSLADSGDYIIMSEQGCTTTITLNVSDPTCDATMIKAEWSLDAGQSYNEAPDEQPVTIDAITGQEVVLSMVPNGINFTVTYGGNEVYSGQDYDLGAVSPSNSGNYIITSEQGCSTTITLNVTDVPCDGDNIRAEWSLDAGANYLAAPDEQPITVTANTGDDVLISMLPNGIDFTVTYEGNQVYSGVANLILGLVDYTNSGDYIITTEQGCSTTLTLDVLCPSGPFTPEYTIDVVTGSGEEVITIDEGTAVQLGIVEDNVNFTITQPGGATSSGDLDLGDITMAQAGLYTFTSEEGCTGTLDIIVTDPCEAGTFTPEYSVNGTTSSGENSITVDLGDTISLDIVQNNVTYTITLPDASTNDGALDLGAITMAQAGTYVFTSSIGCTASVEIIVTDVCAPENFTPEYTVDGATDSGSGSLTVLEGASVSLGLVQGGAFTITLPDDTSQSGMLDLGNITLAQAGDYVYSSDAGCSSTLTIVVNENTNTCPSGSFTPEYTISGVAGSGDATISVIEGTPVILGILETGIDFSITAPNAAVTNGILDLGNITSEQAGNYSFTTDTGCSAVLTINVQAPDATLKDIVIYPNPVRDGNVTFVLQDFMDETIYISFFDIYGKLVLRNLVPADHEAEVVFDVGILSGGTYIVEIARSKKDENTIKKVIKLR